MYSLVRNRRDIGSSTLVDKRTEAQMEITADIDNFVSYTNEKRTKGEKMANKERFFSFPVPHLWNFRIFTGYNLRGVVPVAIL